MIDGLASLPLGLPPLHLRVPAADRAPLLMIGDGHAAFDADPHALRGLRGVRGEEALQKRHSESPGFCDQMLVRNEGRPGYTHARESGDGEEAFIRSADPAKGWDVEDDDGHLGLPARARVFPLDIREAVRSGRSGGGEAESRVATTRSHHSAQTFVPSSPDGIGNVRLPGCKPRVDRSSIHRSLDCNW